MDTTPAESSTSCPAPAEPCQQVVSATLGPKVAADYEALRNDLEQAQAIAADFQREAAGKSNELAEMRMLLEKTTGDLTKLQASIAQLRQERHDLANRVMALSAYELKLKRSEIECERLRKEAEAYRGAVAVAANDGKAEIRRLELENTRLLTQIESLKLHGAAPGSNTAPTFDQTAQVMLAKILSTVEGLRQTVEQMPKRTDLFSDVAFGD